MTDIPEAETTGEAETGVRPTMEPQDEHNKKLVANVHPPDWVNPTPRERYHMVVVGGGTAGLVTAAICAGLGARVALIERHFLGGDCLNVGCVPSKGVITAARAWHQARQAHRDFGAPASVDSAAGDFAAAMERMRRLRAQISPDDSAARFQDLGVDVFLGEGRFVASDAIEVGGHRLKFRRATIATGARAIALPIPGLADIDYLTNETVFSLTSLPKRFGVIGAGPIGSEMAQSLARFGSQVHVLDIADHILPREDQDAAAVVQKAMLADGVKLHLGVKIKEIRQDESDAIEKNRDAKVIVAESADGELVSIPVDALLLSVGRAPNIEGLGLEAAGVDYDIRRGVQVDDFLRTKNRRIYAAGDIVDLPYKFTHAADDHARIVVRNAFFFGRGRAASRVIPWATYTSPEIAHVGLYEEQARELGYGVDTITVPLAENHRAILEGEEEGFLRIHLKKGTDKILGGTLVAEGAGDMIGALALAMTHKLGLAKFASTVFPYPTRGEVYKRAGDAFNKTRLTPTSKSFFELWFKIFK